MERAERKVQLPVIGPRLRPVLGLVLVLGVLLSANSIYLVTVTGVEVVTGNMYQDDYYLIMFLAHLGLGLLLILPLVTFAILHLRKAWFRPNRYAVSAGVSLFMAALVLLISGLLLTRFGFFEINDPSWRNGAYWVHVIAPLVVIWLFVLHRLAGRPLRWRIGAYVSAVAAVPVIGMLLFQFRERAPDLPVSDAYVPALVTLQDVARVRPQRLLQDETCAECHPQIVRQADWSMHRFSSFNNPAYRFSVEEARQVLLRRDGDLHAARLCAVCHDQVPLFSGRFDDPEYDPDQDAGGHAGITCMGCHGIIGVSSPRGNGDYILADPPSYPFASSDSKFLTAVNRQLIKAKPAFHKKTLLRPVHRSAQFCSACHKVHLPYALNHYRWLRGQNHYDSFWQSGMSGHRVDSFYYPERAVANCAHCHMPLTVSDDPSAKDVDGSGQRQVRNHLFAAANTALPALLNSPDESGNDSRVAMLRGAARVDIFGLKEDDINGRLYAPLRPVLPTLEPGRRYLLETVVRTLRIGHHLTQGTSDSNELWLDVRVFADGRLIGHSGQLDEAGEVDPWSYFLNSYVLDRDGNRIERRNAQDVFVALYDHQIPPGAASVVHFAFQVPREIRGAVSAEVSLKYRKFDSRFLRHVRRGDSPYNDLPVTTLASDRVTLGVAGGGGDIAIQQHAVDPWERWNDYGIGLLREGKRGSAQGELRQAEDAFAQTERLNPAHGALNLARVYLKVGRLDEAADALRRAAEANPPAPPWTLAWYTALVDSEYGHLERAIETLEAIAETRFEAARARGFDFSQDTRVLNELGRLLYERSRREQGVSREGLLERAALWLGRLLEIDPEDIEGHYSMARVQASLGNRQLSLRHLELHDRYRPDDQAIEQAVSRHRRMNPPANHAAEAVVIYELQQADGLGKTATPVVAAWQPDRHSKE